MKPTYGDLLQGFGGATIGAMQAGCEPLWGIEYKQLLEGLLTTIS